MAQKKAKTSTTLDPAKLRREMARTQMKYDFVKRVLDEEVPGVVGVRLGLDPQTGTVTERGSRQELNGAEAVDIATWTYGELAAIGDDEAQGVAVWAVYDNSVSELMSSTLVPEQAGFDENGEPTWTYRFDHAPIDEATLGLETVGECVLTDRMRELGLDVDDAKCREVRSELGLNYPLDKQRERTNFDLGGMSDAVVRQGLDKMPFYDALSRAAASGYMTENEFERAIVPAVNAYAETGTYQVPAAFDVPAGSTLADLRRAVGLNYPLEEGKAHADMDSVQWKRHVAPLLENGEGVHAPKGLAAAVEAGALSPHELSFVVKGMQDSKETGRYEIARSVTICGNVDELDPDKGVTRVLSTSSRAAARRAKEQEDMSFGTQQQPAPEEHDREKQPGPDMSFGTGGVAKASKGRELSM